MRPRVSLLTCVLQTNMTTLTTTATAERGPKRFTGGDPHRYRKQKIRKQGRKPVKKKKKKKKKLQWRLHNCGNYTTPNNLSKKSILPQTHYFLRNNAMLTGSAVIVGVAAKAGNQRKGESHKEAARATKIALANVRRSVDLFC